MDLLGWYGLYKCVDKTISCLIPRRTSGVSVFIVSDEVGDKINIPLSKFSTYQQGLHISHNFFIKCNDSCDQDTRSDKVVANVTRDE